MKGKPRKQLPFFLRKTRLLLAKRIVAMLSDTIIFNSVNLNTAKSK